MARRPRSLLISTWRLGDWASPSRTLAPSRAIRMPAVHRVAGSFPSWMIVGPLYCFHSWPSLEQPSGWPSRPPQPLRPGERVDLDRADVTEITRLPRIGPAFAQRIVAWREQHGPFGGLARFDSVPGVGPKLLEALRPYVMFSGAMPSAP